MALLWHRRDLRTADNRGLAAAASDGPPVPVFVIDPAVFSHASPPRVAYLLDALGSLRAAYRELGGDLQVVQGDPETVLAELAASHGVERVVWHADHSGLARERDERVEASLGEAGVATETIQDALLQPPGSVLTKAGTPYKVFSPFHDTWAERDRDAPVSAPEAVAAPETTPLPTLADLGVDEPVATIPAAGEDAARDRLEAFCAGPIYEYADDRDYPAREGTSRLSAPLHFGTIGIRAVWAATEAAHEDGADAAARESVGAFQAQLAWREFYTHVLAAWPATVAENFKDYEQPIDWRDDPEELAAWEAGETGYPIVDAGMRQLRAEAWMHNRVRMIVASFLTKDLLVDWRHGYRHFRAHLIDHDTANDVGGWQWAASTGTDAQPYFRIFNPMTQGERYDPDAAYIRAYVPELADAAPETIHAWPELTPEARSAAAPAYPAPIVDHAERREAALSMFETARGE